MNRCWPATTLPDREAHGEFESEHPGYCGAQDLIISRAELPSKIKPRRSGAEFNCRHPRHYLFEPFGLPCCDFWSAGWPLVSLPLPCLAAGCCERSPPCPVVAG